MSQTAARYPDYRCLLDRCADCGRTITEHAARYHAARRVNLCADCDAVDLRRATLCENDAQPPAAKRTRTFAR